MFRISHVYASAPSGGLSPLKYRPCNMVYVRAKDIIQVVSLYNPDDKPRYTSSDDVKQTYEVRFNCHSLPVGGYITHEPFVKGLIHPDDFDRFERYINGTENPIHDLLEVFRSHPIFGSETSEARKRFKESINSL